MDEQARQPDDRATRAGRRLHEVNQVPHALRQEAQARWGVNVEFNASREDGRYTGPVFTGDNYVAQRVGEKSVVFHLRDQVDFATSEAMQKRNDANRLNDTNLSIRYENDRGKAYFHDPQRAAIEEMFNRIKKTAEEKYGQGKTLDQFSAQLDEIKDVMVEKYREVKNRQFEQRTGQGAQQRDPLERKAPALER